MGYLLRPGTIFVQNWKNVRIFHLILNPVFDRNILQGVPYGVYENIGRR
jgi:hypothetical protein